MATRPRGRPPRGGAEAPTTRARLLAAAAAACVDHGFEGATVADIAARADVSAPAIYNHFGGRVELLVAAARAALAELGSAADATAAGVVRGFLAPEFASTRRLLSELHLAAQRHPQVAELLAAWHGEQADAWVRRVAGRDPADVKAFFVLLLGCCQLDALASLDVDPVDVRTRVERMATTLFPEEASR